jgi:hypothetical protein
MTFLNDLIDTAITAVPVLFAVFVVLRESVRTRPLQPIVVAKVEPDAQVERIIRNARSQALRKFCTQSGIRWRDAYGSGKHLTVTEMRRALLETGYLNLPWVA